MDKNVQVDLFNVIFGLVIIAGGVFVMFDFWVLGGFLATIGLL